MLLERLDSAGRLSVYLVFSPADLRLAAVSVQVSLLASVFRQVLPRADLVERTFFRQPAYLA
jgi:hypothetical protein